MYKRLKVSENRNVELLSQNVLLPTHTKTTCRRYCESGVLDLFFVLRSRMSRIGSLGLDSTLRCFMHGDEVLSQGIDAPRILSTALCCTKKLLCEKYALLKKTMQPTSSSSLLVSQPRAHYRCTTTLLYKYVPP